MSIADAPEGKGVGKLMPELSIVSPSLKTLPTYNNSLEKNPQRRIAETVQPRGDSRKQRGSIRDLPGGSWSGGGEARRESCRGSLKTSGPPHESGKQILRSRVPGHCPGVPFTPRSWMEQRVLDKKCEGGSGEKSPFRALPTTQSPGIKGKAV